MTQKIGFVGVGRMGANMARRLREKEYTLTAVYDTHRPAAVELSKEHLGIDAHLFFPFAIANACTPLDSDTVARKKRRL